jgi:Protein of unknown function (DUF2867)
MIASLDPSNSSSRPTRALWAARWKVGRLLGWDAADSSLGDRVPTLRDRLPADLRAAPPAPDFVALPFTPLYLTGDEFAAEVANQTVHAVLHVGWVSDGVNSFRAQMAALAKPNGLMGTAYVTAIRPFRYLIVYPA